MTSSMLSEGDAVQSPQDQTRDQSKTGEIDKVEDKMSVRAQ